LPKPNEAATENETQNSFDEKQRKKGSKYLSHSDSFNQETNQDIFILCFYTTPITFNVFTIYQYSMTTRY